MNHRRRSVENIIEELRLMKERYPYFSWVKFNDDNFLSIPTADLLDLLQGAVQQHARGPR